MRSHSLAAALAVASCVGTDYGGTNYVTVSTASETWRVVGAKDETNVSFIVVRPDGTSVAYRADASNASAVLAQIAVQQQQIADTLTKMLAQLLPAAKAVLVP